MSLLCCLLRFGGDLLLISSVGGGSCRRKVLWEEVSVGFRVGVGKVS